MPDDALPVLDPDVVATFRGLGPDVLAQIGATWLDDVEVRLASLASAASHGDVTAAARAAHALKGGSGGVGARRVQAAAERLELAAKDGALPSSAALEDVRRLVEEVRPLLTA